MEKENQTLNNLKEEALSIINNVKINNDIFNKPLDEVKEYITNYEMLNNNNIQNNELNLSKTSVKRKNNKIINFFVYGVAGGCITLGIILGVPAVITTFKNAEDPITHYSKMLGHVNVTPEQLANENICTRQNLKEQVKDRVIQENDIYKARIGCDSQSIKLRAEQDKALNK